MLAVLQCLVLLCLTGSSLGARILAISPFPGKSHHLFVRCTITALAKRGHQVVEYSPFPPKTPIPNLTHVELHTKFEQKLDNWNMDVIKSIHNYDKQLFTTSRIWNMNYEVCEDTFKDKNIQKLLKSKEQFDLVITESTFGEESLLVFGHRFGAPTVSIEPFFPWSVITSDAGNALSIATIPELVPFAFTDQMSFSERMLNFMAVCSKLFFYYNVHIPKQNEILRKNYPSAPPLVDLISNVSLYFTNSHPAAINYVRPYTPNIIPIGGIHIVPERTSLSEDIQKFMDEATHGVIYFSLGTVVPVHRLPTETLQMIINIFKKLPQRVLWKIDLDTLPPTSDNVMVKKWVQQPGVLAHPNCVLFMTHGGLFSQQEAIHAGVPTVGIPFFADQPYNIQYNEHRGIGVKLDFYTLSEDSVLKALTTVLSNPKYKENAKRMSQIYRDRPLSPAESAVFWTEYVINHRGAHHLRPASANLSWYQLALLDVLAAILAVTILVVVALAITIKKLSSFLQTNKGPILVGKKND